MKILEKGYVESVLNARLKSKIELSDDSNEKFYSLLLIQLPFKSSKSMNTKFSFLHDIADNKIMMI